MIGASSPEAGFPALAFWLVAPDFVSLEEDEDKDEDEGAASVRGSCGARVNCTPSRGSDPTDALPDTEEEPAFVDIAGLPTPLAGSGAAVID